MKDPKQDLADFTFVYNDYFKPWLDISPAMMKHVDVVYIMLTLMTILSMCLVGWIVFELRRNENLESKNKRLRGDAANSANELLKTNKQLIDKNHLLEQELEDSNVVWSDWSIPLDNAEEQIVHGADLDEWKIPI